MKRKNSSGFVMPYFTSSVYPSSNSGMRKQMTKNISLSSIYDKPKIRKDFSNSNFIAQRTTYRSANRSLFVEKRLNTHENYPRIESGKSHHHANSSKFTFPDFMENKTGKNKGFRIKNHKVLRDILVPAASLRPRNY